MQCRRLCNLTISPAPRTEPKGLESDLFHKLFRAYFSTVWNIDHSFALVLCCDSTVDELALSRRIQRARWKQHQRELKTTDANKQILYSWCLSQPVDTAVKSAVYSKSLYTLWYTLISTNKDNQLCFTLEQTHFLHCQQTRWLNLTILQSPRVQQHKCGSPFRNLKVSA